MTTPRRHHIAVCIAAAVALAAMFFHRTGENGKRYRTAVGSVWTTDYHITYEATADLSDSINQVLAAVDASASVYNDSSLITAINTGRTQRLDRIISLLYSEATHVNSATQGLYDPTVMPLVNAWGFGRQQGAVPTRHELDSLLSFVGMGKTRLSGDSIVRNDPRIQFDFSSIAKGLACDEVARLMTRHQVTNFIIEIGGEVVAAGINEQGNPWHVAVDLPVEDAAAGEQSVLVAELDDSRGIATSGNYRRYRKGNDGNQVGHIVNPLTGEAHPTDVLSATIIASSCMSADAWATACVSMGNERSRALLEQCDTLGVMLITADDDGNFVVWSNARFAQHVTTH